MNHIFISYSRKDERQVTGFVESLRKRNFEIWQDITGKRSGIPYSVKWFEVIEDAIFTASGAIIFQTETWKSSVPCQQEFQLIQETALPFMCISIDRLTWEKDSVIDEAAHWCQEQLTSQENSYCRWMVSGAYRVYKGLPIESYFPTGKQFARNWQWLKQCGILSEQKDFHGPWTDSLTRFLRKARRKLLGNFMHRTMIGIFLLAMAIWIPASLCTLKMAEIASDTASIRSIISSELQRIGNYDPVQAIQMMKKFDVTYEVYVQNIRNKYISLGETFADSASWDYYGQNSVLADLISRNYPTTFYASVADCPVDIVSAGMVQANDRYTVSLSENTSQVFLYDKILDTTRQLLLSTVPELYCFSDTGNELLISAANEVYLYDLLGEAPPRLLTYNFEDIQALACYENRIYAVTEKDHVIVWDSPFLERTAHRQNIAAGEMAQTEDGQIVAVYVDDNHVIKNMNHIEEVFSFPLGSIDQGHIAISSDGSYAAVLYQPNQGSSDWIALVDLSNGAIKQTYDTTYSIAGYTFSEDDKALTVTCFNINKIARINLETGELQVSAGDTYSNPYSIVTYNDKFLVCDILGVLAVYNKDLELVGDYQRTGCMVPQKQLAVSPKYDCLLTAGRGGNSVAGNCRTSLSGNNRSPFVPITSEPMVSTTSLAVNSSGDYVAYGNAGGSVYIWDIGIMDQLWSAHCIPESIVNLLFSKDSKSLYALGSSGTIYQLSIAEITAECIPGESKSIWQMQMRRADQIMRHMDKLGLFLNKWSGS